MNNKSLAAQICRAMGLDPDKVLSIKIEADWRGVMVYVEAKDPPGLADVNLNWREASMDIIIRPSLEDCDD